MVNKLRKKFVIVTTTLMVVVFGIFFAVNTLYNNYWNNIEMAGMLEWITHSGIFSSLQDKEINADLVLDMIDDGRPIVGIILDEDNQIISTKVIGVDDNTVINYISKDILDEMLEKGNSEYKVKQYFYSYSKISENQTLLVIMDDKFRGSILMWWFGIVGLVLLGILALLGITFFLSRFVTEPAEKSLLREKQFISDASHELKTPLGAISINAQALEMEYPNNLYLKNIVSESERMRRLIERLLTLSKLDESEKVNIKEVSLSEICDEMALIYETIAYEKGLSFVYKIEQNISIMGNEDEISQLLAILIDNAIKNVNEKGTIEFICRNEKGSGNIIVSNTGHGITAEELPHIFERFYTTDKSRNNNSFGLGLAIAKAIVERHGGTIEADSEENGMTIFKVLL